MSELEIPDRAYDVAEAFMKTYGADVDALDLASDAINVAALIIVATELRRIAGLAVADLDIVPVMYLRARADELDPQGGPQ